KATGCVQSANSRSRVPCGRNNPSPRLNPRLWKTTYENNTDYLLEDESVERAPRARKNKGCDRTACPISIVVFIVGTESYPTRDGPTADRRAALTPGVWQGHWREIPASGFLLKPDRHEYETDLSLANFESCRRLFLTGFMVR